MKPYVFVGKIKHIKINKSRNEENKSDFKINPLKIQVKMGENQINN